jgi:hypothetical protein
VLAVATTLATFVWQQAVCLAVLAAVSQFLLWVMPTCAVAARLQEARVVLRFRSVKPEAKLAL